MWTVQAANRNVESNIYISRETAEWKVDVKFNWQLYRSFLGGRATSKTLQKSFLKKCLVESATIHCQNRLYLILWPLQINWLKWMEKVKSIRSFLDFGVTDTYWINADLKKFFGKWICFLHSLKVRMLAYNEKKTRNVTLFNRFGRKITAFAFVKIGFQ